ncbi:MAG: hypothetical protein IH586_23335 [Anaerolineaceae bacterium]|nr:hypothetical protein [Anaerolineaceae bacterium]
MVSLIVVFWMYVILFAIIGAMRGWARELLVSFAVILGLFIITVLERFVPFIGTTLDSIPAFQFWLRGAMITALVFFGYQTPNIPRLASQNRFARDRLQDILLGVFLGALNGYLITGSIWFYLNDAGYPFPNLISAPTDQVLVVTERMMALMPPQLLGGSSAIYFAVALAFAFVLVVFI